ncbi:MAG: hypothetical protein LBQ43_03810 [Holosporales bacterium]|jgi:hypothetical protein|nr:hypothetical protein [Holosporales bacterium]
MNHSMKVMCSFFLLFSARGAVCSDYVKMTGGVCCLYTAGRAVCKYQWPEVFRDVEYDNRSTLQKILSNPWVTSLTPVLIAFSTVFSGVEPYVIFSVLAIGGTQMLFDAYKVGRRCCCKAHDNSEADYDGETYYDSGAHDGETYYDSETYTLSPEDCEPLGETNAYDSSVSCSQSLWPLVRCDSKSYYNSEIHDGSNVHLNSVVIDGGDVHHDSNSNDVYHDNEAHGGSDVHLETHGGVETHDSLIEVMQLVQRQQDMEHFENFLNDHESMFPPDFLQFWHEHML